MVTGAAGFIGRNLIESLAKTDYEVYAVDSLNSLLYSAGLKRMNFEYISKLENVSCVEIDINELRCSGELKDIDVIVNLAAIPGQSLSWEYTHDYMKSNFLGVNNLIKEFCLDTSTYFIQASTSSVYGEFANGNNKNSLNPNNPYGVTKLAAENLIRSYDQNYGLNYCLLRLFSVYGPYQRPDMGVYKFLNNINNGEAVSIFGDGSQSRSLTYVNDVVNSILKVINIKPLKICVDVSGSEVITVNELVSLCEEIVGKKAQINYVPTPKGDQRITIGDINGYKQVFGEHSDTDIRIGLRAQFDQVRIGAKH